MSEAPVITPDTPENRELLDNVHPVDWVNPQPAGRYNLVVIGAGTAGLVCAAGAAGLGARVALVERHLMGGGLPQLRVRSVQGADPRRQGPV